MPSGLPRHFDDDPSIAGAERLLRRIPPSWLRRDPDGALVPDDQGRPQISSAAFRDRELSINLETVMRQAGRSPKDAIAGRPDCGVAAITASLARSHSQAVARDPIPDEPAHGVVFGNKRSKHVDKKLAQAADWIVNPP